MALSAKLRRAPMRIATGAYILNSGVTKMQVDDETAKGLHGTATGTYEFVGKMDPKTFSRVLGAGEITVGALLLAPVVPPVVAGAALMGFSGLLLNMWWNTPGMHEEGSLRPTHQGAPIAKDVWMFGIGTGLVLDGILEPAHDKRLELTTAAGERANMKRKQARQARKAAKASAKKAARSDKAKRAQGVSHGAAERLAGIRDEYGPVAAEKARLARKRTKELADEYGPVAAEKAQQARDRAKALADEYGPVAAEKARQAQAAARDAAERARAAVR